jgi:predicted permease
MSVQRDIDAELRFHFDARIDELMSQGLSREAARAQAEAEFGNVNEVRDGLRAIDRRVAKRRNRAEVFGALLEDVRYAARSLRRTPAVSLTIIVTLALGIGVNAAMFSLLDVIYLRPPAGVSKAGDLRRVWVERRFRDGKQYWPGFDYTSYLAMKEAAGNAADVMVYLRPSRQTIGLGENAATASLSPAQPSYFRVLGVKAARGRLYTDQEAALGNSAPVAVISDDFWARQFNRDPDVVGKTLTIATRRYDVIGVLPPGFVGIDLDVADVWTPIESSLPPGRRKVSWWSNPGVNGFEVVFRAAPGVSDESLVARFTRTARAAREGAFHDSLAVVDVGAINVARGPGKVSGELQVAERLAGVAIIVLLIACANVVNLLLARAANRRKEIAVRLALGISRARLVRLLVTESVLLATVACVAALAAAQWGVTVLQKLLLPNVQWAGTTLHWRLLLLALLATIATGVVTGLIPALQSSTPDLADGLRAGSRQSGAHRSPLRSALVVAQTALSVVLLVGAVLFIRSVQNVMAQDIGYAVDRLAFASVSYATRDSIRDAAIPARLRALESRIAGIPGVERVALASDRPKNSISFTTYFAEADTAGRRQPDGIISMVSREYFETTGMRIVSGATFPDDRFARGSPPVIVNSAIAEALWPHENPIGRCVHFEQRDAPCGTIVGVVETGIFDHIGEKPQPQFYLSLDNTPVKWLAANAIVINGDPRRLSSIQPIVAQALRDEFPGAVPRVTTMSSVMAPEYRPWVLGAKLFTVFGLLALVVAGVGLYSSVSYGVTQRTHEFGVRMALGARASDVVRQVLAEGVKTIVVGAVAGILLALATGRLIASLLYGVAPSDPFALLTVVVVLLLVALAAAFRPAFRASRFDPVAALRAE